MSWFKRNIGLDWFDLLLHGAVTFAMVVWAAVNHAIWIGPGIVVASLGALAIRRHFGLKSLGKEGDEGLSTSAMVAYRLDEVENRLGELDQANARIAELEERLDFAERLLAQGAADRVRLQGSKSEPRGSRDVIPTPS